MKKSLVHAVFSMFMLIVFTQSAYTQWVQTNWPESSSFFSLYANQDKVFARTWDSLNGGRVFLTTDNGAKWTQISSADSDIDILSIITFNNRVLAGTWDNFYQSDLNDPEWEAMAPGGIPADSAIWSVAMSGNTLLAGTMGHVFKSTAEDPNIWTEISTGIPANVRITSLITDGNSIFAGSDSNGVFVSANDWTNWTAINSGLTNKHISQLATAGTKLFAVTLKDMFVFDANGIKWTADSSGLKNINCLLVSNNFLFAGTDSNGVYLSNDRGLSWLSISAGLPADTRVWSLAAAAGNIFAGTNSGIWRLKQVDSNDFTIKAGASEGGTIRPDGEVTVCAYGSQTFTITPLLGYRISNVLVDGSSAGAVDSYTFSYAATNHTISAAFTAVPIHTITSSAGNGGTISLSGSVLVSEGSSQKFTIAALPGYIISAVIVDGNSVGAVSTYTFTNITENHSISATFATAPFKITASAGIGGSISPSGTVEVMAGSSQTFTITPSAGYEISSVVIDGVSVGAVTSYTFSPVISDHTIVASFGSLFKYQINCGGGASSPYTADQYYIGGSAHSVTSNITVTGVTNPAPQAVYQTERTGTFTYTFPDLAGGATFLVRLHFSENTLPAANIRKFDVAINGITVLSNYDIFSETGARFKVLVKEFTAAANTSGQIVIKFTTVSYSAAIGGIEIIKQ